MKRKISGALAASLIVGQFQGVAFAETSAKLEDFDVSNENVSESTETTPEQNDQEIIKPEDGNQVETEEMDVQEGTNSEEEVQDVDLPEEENHEEVASEVDEQEEGSEEVTPVESDSEGNEVELVAAVPYKSNGKLELDLNFMLPIKHTTKEATNLQVNLKKDNNIVETIELGLDHTSTNNTTYILNALNSKRQPLTADETDVSFYHLTFEQLELGTYTLEISGAGYQTATVGNIDVTTTSKRVLLGTSDNMIVIDDKGTPEEDDDIKEVYPGVLLAGEINGDQSIDQDDYEVLKNHIKHNTGSDAKYDLNRDGKVDITDLTYVHQNMNQAASNAIILDTDLIIDPDNVNVELSQTTVLENGSEIKDLLKDNDSVVGLKSTTDAPISETNPIKIDFNLAGTTRAGEKVEQIMIKAPIENAPTSGSIVISGAGENGGDLTVSFDETNTKQTYQVARDGQAQSEIVVNLGQQVAVSQITINVTGSRSNKNLVEIAKVDFLNNVYEEMPEPNMNVPVINYFTSATAVGNEHFVVGWDHQTNVTGYELKVELLNKDGSVAKTSTYKTSDNRLKVEEIDGYSVYRISIQSLSGDWKSGFKDEQEGYDANVTGDTNLVNKVNDKDGRPDNVDENYTPIGWDSINGTLLESGSGEKGQAFGADSIIELQVIPETAPEGPEGIVVKGGYKQLEVSWKSHKKAQDYDLYYRKVGGDGAWIKANDPDQNYVDSDKTNDIPDGVANLTPNQKTDSDELIRATSYKITGLEENATYEIKMTATNHHGTGGLSQTYLGTTTKLTPPITTNYKLINTPNDVNEITQHVVSVEYPTGTATDADAIVDNDYTTVWEYMDWDYGGSGPVVTFDQKYTMKELKVIRRLDVAELTYQTRIEFYNEATGAWETVGSNFTETDNEKVLNITLDRPITTKKIRIGISVYPSVPWGDYRNAVSISEVKFYEYDSLQSDVDALFKDDLMLELSDDVTQEQIDELVTRANTIDPVNMEYHPNQAQILSDLQRAQDLLNDAKLSDNIKSLDVGIRNAGKTIGQSNDYQALGVAVKPGDKVTIYIGSSRKDTQFKLAITQHNAESGTAVQTYSQNLVVGKNEIVIPESAFNMDYEKGGNLYLRFERNYNDGQDVQVRVSGGTEIPHLNVNNMINDSSKEMEVKEAIRTYIRELKSYVSSLPNRYPQTADKTNNIYTYDPETSILNSTEIEGDRITLSLTADQVLAGITSGLSTEDEQVERLYDNLRAWEQLMEVSYLQQGLIEEAIDVDGDGKITNTPQAALNGKSEQQFFNENQAPLNRINVKYQRMFTGAFMYASSHHVGIGYGSIAGMMGGIPYEFDENGNLTNADVAKLFGWGINHEIGHVHDVNGLTYAEVTNNILALITQTFDDIDESKIEGAYDQVYEKVTSGSVGPASSGLVRLAMFWQLHLAYDNAHTYEMLELNKDANLENDTFYAKLYRMTREKGIADSESGHDRTAQTFIMRASDAVGKDLREFFAKWGMVASPKTNAYLNKQNYPKEDKAIYYLNDEARRKRLETLDNNNLSSLIMAEDTTVTASFGLDQDGKQITDKTYLNQKEVPLQLSATKDNDKILGYEIIKIESTSQGLQEVVSGFVERNQDSNITEYVDVIDVMNNRTFGYKVRAYDYNLNVTEETVVGTVKVSHDGSIKKTDWQFDTNTRGVDDVADEHTGHGHDEQGSINHIKDNDVSTVYNAVKATNNNGQEMSGDPYVTIEMDQIKSIVGLKYTPGTTKQKFSLRNLFTRNKEQTYDPISNYEVYVSQDGSSWTKAHSGTFDTTRENTIYFNEKGSNDNSQLWAYNAKYVKLVAKGATSISIAELDILGPQGDNIEIGMDNNDQNYQNGVGKLKSDYEYAPGQVIPAGSILVMGEYKGDPAFNVPLVLNENNENFALNAQAILLANLPADSQLGEVAEGNWIYWITPDQQAQTGNIEGTQVKAELYRYNKLDAQGAPVGQRLVSDTFLVDIALNNLPTIDLNDIHTRAISYAYDEVIEIDSETLQQVTENR